MPEWIVTILKPIGGPEAIAGFIAAIVVGIWGRVRKIRAEQRAEQKRWRREAEEAEREARQREHDMSVRDPSEYEERLRALYRQESEQLRSEVRRTQWALEDARHQLRVARIDLDEEAREHAAKGAALHLLRGECDELARENERLHALLVELIVLCEQAGIQVSIAVPPPRRPSPSVAAILRRRTPPPGALPAPAWPVHVEEVDDRRTPTRPHRAMKRAEIEPPLPSGPLPPDK